MIDPLYKIHEQLSNYSQLYTVVYYSLMGLSVCLSVGSRMWFVKMANLMTEITLVCSTVPTSGDM